MQHIWLSECDSLVQRLHNASDTRSENVRLSIDIAGLRQRLWTDKSGELYDELPADKDAANIVPWIDTSTIPVDCMTKKMEADVSWKVMRGRLVLMPTSENVLTKIRKQKLRNAKAGRNRTKNA